jgi:hypothetical protein
MTEMGQGMGDQVEQELLGQFPFRNPLRAEWLELIPNAQVVALLTCKLCHKAGLK